MEQFTSHLHEFLASRPSLQALCSALSILCHLLGLYFAVVLALSLAQGFKLYFLTRSCCRVNFAKKYGQWALVTGSGDGIGRALLVELARRGMSVLVIDRDEEKLTATRQILEQIPECGQIETLKTDLSDWSAENYATIRARIKPEQRDIGILINCVATLPYRAAPFVEFHRAAMTTMVNLNVLAAVHMTRIIAPGMLARRRGLIVNVASLAASLPAPGLNLYGPTKAFVEAFTRQLQMELESEPIDVVLLKPGPVVTSLADPSGRLQSSIIVPGPEDYAKSVIGALPAVPEMYTGSPVHGLLRLLMEATLALGLFRLVTKFIARKHAKNYEKTKGLIETVDKQRTNQSDDEAKDATMLKAAPGENPQDISIEMNSAKSS